MEPLSKMAFAQVTRYQANKVFTQASLFFKDGSSLQFEHTVGKRWAKASASPSQADIICQSLRLFRLNAKHLQLFF
jgi:hypothetical protein